MGIYDNYKKYVLDNKLEYVLIPNNYLKSFSFYVFIRAGSRDEVEKNRGSSHLLEHMLFKGTTKRKSYNIINKEFDRLGGVFNAFTTKNITGYYIKAPSKFLEKSIELLADLLFNSLIREKDIEKEKQVVIEELARMLDDNERYSLELAFKMALAKHPLEHLVIGTEKHIQNFSRKDIVAYYKKYYNPANMFISVCGNYGDVHHLIKKYFSVNTQSTFTNPIPNIPLTIQKIPKINIIKKDKEQTSISIAFPTCDMYDIKKSSIVQVIAIALGGGVSSRLYEEVREKEALAYTISVDCEFFQDTGIFYIVTGVEKESLFKNKNLKNDNGALYILLRELNKISKEGIKKEELERVKESITGKLIIQQEDTSSIAEFYGYQLAYKKSKIITLKDTERLFNTISLGEVNNMCVQLFDFSKMNISIIGNYEKKNIVNYLYERFHSN